MLLNCNCCAKTVSSNCRRCPHCTADLGEVMTISQKKSVGVFAKYKNSVNGILLKRKLFKK